MFDQPVRGVLPEPGFYSLSGLERLRAYQQQRVPAAPHARLLGYRVTQASSGTAVLTQPISSWFEIYDGFIDLQATAGASVYVTALTAAPPASHLVPVTLSLRYLRPCTIDDESLIARGRVLHAGSNFTTVETLIEDVLGRAVAHATGCVRAVPIEPAPPPAPHTLDVQVDEPVYPTPDPWRAPVPASVGSTGLPLAGVFLGLEIVEVSDSRAVATMPTTEWFCNGQREVEAGIIGAHANLTASLVMSRIARPDERAVTFEVTSSFLAAAIPDGRSLIATATLRARMGEVFVIDVETVDADGRPVGVMRGTLMLRERRSPHPRRPSNRVLLTVLFTDVVASTVRASAVGDKQWRETLDQHDAIVGRQIEIHMGRRVKTTGDGVLATFDSPSRAVDCARDIRERLSKLDLEIRAGIHSGECEVSGGDVAGLAVHVASRVQSTAEPGQILVTNTVRDLVAGSGLHLIDRGPHELKGLEGNWTLLSVEAPSGR